MTKTKEVTVDAKQEISEEEKTLVHFEKVWKKIETLPDNERFMLERSLGFTLKGWQDTFMHTVGEVYDVINDSYWALERAVDIIEGKRTYFQHMRDWHPGYLDLPEEDIDAHPLEDIHENLRICIDEDYCPEDTLNDEEKLELALLLFFSSNPDNNDKEFRLRKLREQVEVSSEDESKGAYNRVEILKRILSEYAEESYPEEYDAPAAELISSNT